MSTKLSLAGSSAVCMRRDKPNKNPGKEMKRTHCFMPALLSIVLSSLLAPPESAAQDWGYDGAAPAPPPAPIEQSAAGLARSLKTKPDKITPAGASKAPVAQAQKGKKPGTPNSAPPVVSPFARKAPGSAPAKVGANIQPPPANLPTPNTVPDKSGETRRHSDLLLDYDQQAARCWLQLFQVCCKQSMDYTQQKQMESYMLGRARLGEKQNQEVRAILKFWPKLLEDLRGKPELEMHYADLFRALLRLHEKTSKEKFEITGSPYKSDADLISNLLGLERIAVPGDPAFTEDAVNAYSDMAIFIYEQQHDGRTIDASDNRSLFAKVVVEKFNRAPTDADQRAMASFDLAWAKFKVIWHSSDEKTHKLLLDKLIKSGAGSTLTVSKDPLLDTVLSNWPWKTTP